MQLFQDRGQHLGRGRLLVQQLSPFGRKRKHLGSEPGVRDINTIDPELRLVAALRRAARERGGPLPSIEVADALLDERC
jgi:hypothetical protein